MRGASEHGNCETSEEAEVRTPEGRRGENFGVEGSG